MLFHAVISTVFYTSFPAELIALQMCLILIL